MAKLSPNEKKRLYTFLHKTEKFELETGQRCFTEKYEGYPTRRVCEYFVDGWHFTNREQQTPRARVKCHPSTKYSHTRRDPRDVDFIAISKYFHDSDLYDVRRFEIGNKTKNNVIEWFSTFAKDTNNDNIKASVYDKYVFVFLSTMTSEDCIRVGSRDSLPMTKVYDAVKTSPLMAGKQKVFVVQADDERIVKALQEPQAKGYKILPQDADRLIIISTLPQILANLEPNLPPPNIVGNIDHYKIDVTGKDECLPLTKEPGVSFMIQAFIATVKDCRDGNQEFFKNTPGIVKRVNELLIPFREQFKSIDFPLPLVTSTLTQPLTFK